MRLPADLRENLQFATKIGGFLRKSALWVLSFSLSLSLSLGLSPQSCPDFKAHSKHHVGVTFPNPLVFRSIFDSMKRGRTLKGSYSPSGRPSHLLETPFSEPLLRTLLRAFCTVNPQQPPV